MFKLKLTADRLFEMGTKILMSKKMKAGAVDMNVRKSKRLPWKILSSKPKSKLILRLFELSSGYTSCKLKNRKKFYS
jgi:hypothetical protein